AAPSSSSSSQRYALPVSPALLSITQRSGTTCGLVHRLPSGSSCGRSSTSCTGLVVPSTAAYWPTTNAPLPSSALSVSAPPANTGVPFGSPVAADADVETRPTSVPVSTSGGRIDAGTPSASSSSVDQSRRVTSYSIDSLAFECS